MNFEALLFKRVYVWVVLLFAILGLIFTFIFGVLVADDVSGRDRFGGASTIAGEIAAVPETLNYLLRKEKNAMVAFNSTRFPGKSGWTPMADRQPIPGYLLLSRYDGDLTRHIIELVDLGDLSVKHSWLPDADGFLADVPRTSKVASFSRWKTSRYRAIHPIALDGGDLLIKDHQSPLIRIGACSNTIWRNQESTFHHSTEPVGDGTFWIPTTIEPSSFEAGDNFIDDAVALVNGDGEILLEQSIAQAMIDNGLIHKIFTAGAYNKDPIHLNDIQPVLRDGPFWKKGDLFLSMRPLSMIMLYRPSTQEVVWFKEGPWMAQHDVDIIDDHTISVFSNNSYDLGRGGYVEEVSELFHYDFETDTVTSPYRQAMETHNIFTLFEGLADAIPGGRLMVEEENSGRIVIINDQGGLEAEFVNRSEDGKIYRLGWSRYMDQDAGDRLAASLANITCP